MAALLAVLSLSAGGASSVEAAEFDRTVPAARGTRLDVRLFGGQIVVRAWPKDAVRVRATHFRTDEIDLRSEGQALLVRARARKGTAHAIDFDISVPVWMAIDLSGTYLDVAVAGTEADVAVKTVRGDIRVTGGAGTVKLESIDGEITLEGAKAQADLSSVNNGIRVTGLRGQLLADTINGNVTLRQIEASVVEVTTAGGDIVWNGSLAPAGRYQFATHSGAIDVGLAADASAKVDVRVFQGTFRATFPLTLPPPSGGQQRFSFVVGAGAARLDLETFNGPITLRRP